MLVRPDGAGGRAVLVGSQFDARPSASRQWQKAHCRPRRNWSLQRESSPAKRWRVRRANEPGLTAREPMDAQRGRQFQSTVVNRWQARHNFFSLNFLEAPPIQLTRGRKRLRRNYAEKPVLLPRATRKFVIRNNGSYLRLPWPSLQPRCQPCPENFQVTPGALVHARGCACS